VKQDLAVGPDPAEWIAKPWKENLMNTKFGLAIAAIVLGAGMACATSDAASRSSAPNPTNAEIDAAETGVPASVDYANRPIAPHSPTNAEIEAAEQNNPYDVGYKDRTGPKSDPNGKADWESSESGTPAEQSAQPDKR